MYPLKASWARRPTWRPTSRRWVPPDPAPREGRPYPRRARSPRNPTYQARGSATSDCLAGRASSTKAILLLRLGRADLAEHVWKGGLDWARDTRRPNERATRIWRPTGRGLLDRGRRPAHARGDDRLALASLARAGPHPAPDARGEAGVVKPPPMPGPRPRLPRPAPTVPGRPGAAGRRAEASPRGSSRSPADRSERIAALIRDFDRLSIRALDPGRASPSFPPRRPPSWPSSRRGMPPSGRCSIAWSRDDRLTRIVDPGCAVPVRYVRVQGVDESAYEALTRSWVRESGRSARYYGGRSDRAKRKAVHGRDPAITGRRTGGSAPWSACSPTLADDAATPTNGSTRPRPWPSRTSSAGGAWCTCPPSPSAAEVPPRGEPLRARANPSVTELLARRYPARSTIARRTAGLLPPRSDAANRMAVFLAAWDPKGALPTLKDRVTPVPSRSSASARE